MTIDRETLAAYADGELDDLAAKRVERAIAGDPALAAEIEAHRALKARLAAHFAPVAEAAVPERLTALLGRDTKVVDLAAARAARRAEPAGRWTRWAAGGAIAASLLVAVGIGWNRDVAPSAGGFAEGALDRALSTQLAAAGAVDGRRIFLTFKDKRGGLCRGFEGDGMAGVACRSGDRWKIERVVPAGAPSRSDYAQASSGKGEVLAAAQDMADGPALDAQAEAVALAMLPRQR